MIRSSTFRTIITYIFILVGIMVVIPSSSFSKDLETRHIFKIERSKNANIVQYDVQLTPDGKLYAKEAVIAYWIRLAKDGQRKELTSTQVRWAYGFKTKYNADDNIATLEMKAGIGRKIKVYAVDGVYHGETKIDGKPAFIERIYITTVEGGMIPKVKSIRLYGKDISTGEERYEKIKP